MRGRVFPANRRMNLGLFTDYGFAQNWHKKVTQASQK